MHCKIYTAGNTRAHSFHAGAVDAAERRISAKIRYAKAEIG